jgi:uncharacterized 2Fe-2S/4Fe-4S cluster protein (DUF4445 family)
LTLHERALYHFTGMTVLLTVLPDNRRLQVESGTTILRAAQSGGIEVTATCGGRGRCTSCRVKFVAGNVPPPTIMDELQLGGDLVREGYRLSCQCHVSESITVQVAPPLDEQAFQILGADSRFQEATRAVIDAGIDKRAFTVSLPTDEHHQTSDLEALLAAAGRSTEDVSPALLRDLPGTLRQSDGEVTVVTFGRQVLSVEAGDTTSMRFGLAADIGTTSVVTTLLDLETGEQLASVSSLNPQAAFGGDLMSRIAFAQQNPANLRKLHTRIIGLLNQHVEQIVRQSGMLARHIYKIVVVGNTCMHHILLGIDPSHVGQSPYAPVMRHPVVLPARDLFLKVNPEARVCLLPIVAGFVGADTMGVALATRIHDSSEIRIVVDIGTNGEVLLGSKTHLWACSAPAGPALEGAQLKHGMRGALGAIDRVTVTDDVEVHTIGEAPAIGICGSGTIDALAAMLDAGILDASGLIRVDHRDRLPPRLRERVVRRDGGRQFILVHPGEAGATGEIVLTQGDIREVQLAKGAIASGMALLQKVAGVSTDQIAELMLAGGFGNYLSIKSALRIGLIPALPVEKIRYVGNAALLGAQLCLVSEAERRRAEGIARSIEHVSLAVHPDFQEIFVECLTFPRS